MESTVRAARQPSSVLLVRGPDALRLFTRILYWAMGVTVVALFVVPWQQNTPAGASFIT